MKRLFPLVLCLAGISYGQQTARVPIIILGGEDAAIAANSPILKVEVDHEPAGMTSITPLVGQHLRYLLMNDGSAGNQWQGGIKQQTQVADQLLKQLVSNADVGSLINFADDIYIDVASEQNAQLLSAKLERQGKGGTALADAVISATRWFSKQALGPDYRKVIFLICDGRDTTSTHRLNQAIEALQRAAIPVFVIAASTEASNSQGDNLRRLARETGGDAYFVSDDPKQAFESIRHDLDRGFLLQVSVPSSKKMIPLDVSDPAKQFSIIAAPQVVGQ